MKNEVRKMSEAAALLALGVLLPLFFHLFGAGSIFLPMHLSILLGGFLLGPFYGVLLGLLTPLLSFLSTGMPPVAALPGMIVELAFYGLASGVFFRKIKTHHLYLDITLSLFSAMLIGRIAGGFTNWAIYSSSGKAYSFALWATTYFVSSWPGILLQVVAVPLLLIALIKSHLWSENERYFDPEKIARAEQKEQTAFFDSLAPHWEEKRSLDEAKIKTLLAKCQFQKGERVLDVACGDGVLDEALLQEGVIVEGIDLSFEMIKKAKELHQKDHLSYFCGDFYTFQPEEKYDVLIVFDSYPHFLDVDRFEKKAAQLLKKGGRLYILHDASKETINAFHSSEKTRHVSRGLLTPKKEAFPYWKSFKKGRTEDEADHYFLELIRR
jgi:2-polyprenyl-3-methyl-5-hydroxy-6-metoxy-1,4-benzoquinol methylase/thiamine transporter ThiT